MVHRKPPKPIPVGPDYFGLAKLGASRFDLRDPYHLAVSLSWPGFVGVTMASWIVLNLIFAELYILSPNAITNVQAGSFLNAFFFSIETLSTVGYGTMAPATVYGHAMSAVETVTGLAFTAIVTGLLFVRFSRAKPKIAYADDVVVTRHNGCPTLMIRLINARMAIMSGANARLFVLLGETTTEGKYLRRIHELRLVQSHLPLFVMPWLLMHKIDEHSPLAGHDAASLAAHEARLFLTIEARDHVLSAVVQDLKHYSTERIRYGMRFADAVIVDESGRATADVSRIGLLEPGEDSLEDTVSFQQPHDVSS